MATCMWINSCLYLVPHDMKSRNASRVMGAKHTASMKREKNMHSLSRAEKTYSPCQGRKNHAGGKTCFLCRGRESHVTRVEGRKICSSHQSGWNMQSVPNVGKHATYTKHRKVRMTQVTFAFASYWVEYSEGCPDQGSCCYLASV